MPLRIPKLLRPVAEIAKWGIRQLVRYRLDHWPLSANAASYWAEKFKKWPAIFNPTPYRRLVEITPGITVQAGLVDIIQRSLITEGEWDRKVLLALRSLLSPGNTFIDVGANIGYFSLIASALVGDEGRVVALEPSLRALTQITDNIARNGVKNVLLLSVAAGSKLNLMTLHQTTVANIGASSLRDLTDSVGFEHVAVYTLDELIEPLKLSPDVIKIDVEGFEFDVLSGAEQILRRYHPSVLCEVTVDWMRGRDQRPNDLFTFMEALGYRAYTIEFSDTLRLTVVSDFSRRDAKFQEEICFIHPDRSSLVHTLGLATSRNAVGVNP